MVRVAIECYLDFLQKKETPIKVRYNRLNCDAEGKEPDLRDHTLYNPIHRKRPNKMNTGGEEISRGLAKKEGKGKRLRVDMRGHPRVMEMFQS